MARRGVQISPRCPGCEEAESAEHLVIGYSWTHHVWQEILGFQTPANRRNMLEWMLGGSQDLARPITTNVGVDARDVCMVTCWAIWKACNRLVFDNKRPCVAAVVLEINVSVQEFSTTSRRILATQQPSTTMNRGRQTWAKPARGWVDQNQLRCDVVRDH